MKRSLLSLSLCLLPFSIWGCDDNNSFTEISGQQNPNPPQQVVYADRIFMGGPILTIEPMAEAQALAVLDDRILAVGALQDVMRHQGPNTEVRDLDGHTLMPGLVEPHTHIDVTANTNMSLNVGSEQLGQTVANVTQLLTAELPKVPAGGWLQAAQFDPSRNNPFFATLTLQDLDAVSTDVPIFVLNDSGHIAYVNSKALEIAGITNSTPNPPGGVYVKDAQGNLTGQLNEPSAYQAFYAKIPPPTGPELTLEFGKVLESFSAEGVTTIGDLNTGLAFGMKTTLAIMKAMAPDSPVRVRSYLSYLALDKSEPTPVGVNEGDDKLKFIGIKFTTDGSTQGYTAALREPYITTAGGSGTGPLDYPTEAALLADAKPFFDAGWQLAMHSNGDAAIDQALEVYASLLAGTSDPASRRLRVEHFTVNHPSQIAIAKELGLTVSMTIGHTFYWGDAFRQILGLQRANRIDPSASLKASGITYSYHSDCPVTTVDPLRYVQQAVVRIPQGSTEVLGAAERVTVDDALRGVTIDAAYQLFMEDKVGSLTPGKYADLVILEKNPRTTPALDIEDIKVEEVYLGGERVR